MTTDPTNETVFCAHCKKQVHTHTDPVNHVKNLLLSLFTLGLWIPIWWGLTYRPTRLCDECNEPIWDTNL